MLWLDMGLGKTVVTLTSIAERMDALECWGALVVGPLRVVQSVWRQEAAKWSHLRHLKFSLIHGVKDVRATAALTKADIYLVNYEGLNWLADYWTHHYLKRGRYLPINMVVLDEVPRVKNPGAIMSKATHRIRRFAPYSIGLTGTPAGNGYDDLFGQYLAVDMGKSLGTERTIFRERFMRPENAGTRFSRQVAIKEAKAAIENHIAPITVQMKNSDYLELPPVVENVIGLELTPELQDKYTTLEEELWLELDSGHEIVSFSQLSAMGRCLQFAQGAVYLGPGDPRFEVIHDIKLEALESVVQEANGKPVLVAVPYQHDAKRILKKYPGWVWISSKMGEAKFEQALNDWEAGKLPGIVANPLSMGHGLDRLKSGPVDDLVWFGHTYALDAYEQTIARLQRQGRTRPIRMTRLIMGKTIEVAQCYALRDKAKDQNGLKEAINQYRREL